MRAYEMKSGSWMLGGGGSPSTGWELGRAGGDTLEDRAQRLK